MTQGVAKKPRYTDQGAIITPDKNYRYILWREWSKARLCCLFVMLNPSTADGKTDDATLRRCVGFAKRWGYGSLRVVNLFAWRATNPAELLTQPSPVGSQNDTFIGHAVAGCSMVVCAWGSLPGSPTGPLTIRTHEVWDIIKGHPRVLAFRPLTKAGQPRHPLRLRADSVPREWHGPA